ncbi:MAG: hypothetical protein JXR70_02765 [Spirochaetales bacterium]|nr:hypothetical protein [Spirochaetales bacterium]
MKCLFVSITLVLFCLNSFANSLEFSQETGAGFEVDPGSHLTFTLSVKNNSSSVMKIFPELKLPEGWQIIIPDFDYTLFPGEVSFRMGSVLIPGRTLAGDYILKYLAKDLQGNSLGFFEFSVRVLTQVEFLIELLHAPDYIIAGEDYHVSYIVYNTGNTASPLEYSVISGENLGFLLENSQSSYPPVMKAGSSLQIDIQIGTPKSLSKLMSHRLELRIPLPPKAQARLGKKILQGVTYVEIVPPVSGKGEDFFTLPGSLSNSMTGQFLLENKVVSNNIFQMKGSLDENSYHNLDVYLEKTMDSSSSDFQQVLINAEDEYRVKYRNPHFDVLLGDAGYSLSPLLEEYRFGRGVQSRLFFGPFQAGGYYHQTYLENPVPHYGAGFFQWLIPNDSLKKGVSYRVKASVHTADANNWTSGIYQEWNPLDQINITGDAALSINPQGQLAPAVMLKGTGEHEWGGYNLDFHYADPNFSGFYKDEFYLLTSGGLNLLNNSLRLYAAYQIQEKNMLRNSDKGTSMGENTLNTAVNYVYLPWNSNIYLQYKNRNRQDLYKNPEYNDWENALTLNYRQNSDDFRFNFSSEISHTINIISNDQVLKQKYLTGFGYKPNEAFDSSFSIRYQNESPSYYSSSHILGWSLNMIYQNNDFVLNTDAKNHFVLRDNMFSGVAFSIGTDMEIKLPQNQLLAAGVNYLLSNNYDEWTNNLSVEVGYSLPLAIPLGRRLNIGSLKGQLYNEQSGEAIEGVVIRLGGQAVVTNSKGTFEFSGLKPGEYFVNIDRNRLDKKQIPRMQTPIRVKINKGEETLLKIPITLASSIFGRIVQYDFSNDNNQFFIIGEDEEKTVEYKSVGGIEQVLLELSNGKEIKRRVSDSNGRFIFEELYSGSWSLTILAGHLPEYHYYEKQNFSIDLNLDDHREIEVRVLPEKRGIEMIDGPLLEPVDISN